jgi:hypothetical protein
MTRFIKCLLLSFALLLSPLFAGVVQAQTITAASCIISDVQAAINLAVLGGTVIVPAGTCNWTGIAGLSISGISLIGAGKSLSGTVITAGTVTMTKHASKLTRLSGFRFTGTDVHVTVNLGPSLRAYIIDNCYFFNGGAGNFLNLNSNGGLLHHNDFFMNPSTSPGPDVFALHAGEPSWPQPTTFGNTDTQGPQGGERNIYFEDNNFYNILETMPDGDVGARLVIRHNLYQDSSMVVHSAGPINDTGDSNSGGAQQLEVYSNTFKRVLNSNPIGKWIWMRGESGVIANNVMDRASSPDGTTYPNKDDIRLGVGCPGLPPYPIPRQIGQTTASSTENPPSHPLLIFGNTGAATSDSNFITIIANNTGGGGHDCSSPGTYIQVNRDYYLDNNNRWAGGTAWTAFTYPHPLAQGSSSGPPPAAPSNLAAVVK